MYEIFNDRVFKFGTIYYAIRDGILYIYIGSQQAIFQEEAERLKELTKAPKVRTAVYSIVRKN